MKQSKLQDMFKGWFIGNITPAVYTTKACEVAVKHYKTGDYEGKHYHKIATEITVIIAGKVKIGGVDYSDGDIIRIEPGEEVDFLCQKDAITVVVKIPGANNDKFISE